MALFSNKKNTKAASIATKETKVVPAMREMHGSTTDLSHVILNPRITEKATMHESAGAYTFDVSVRASKREILQAVKDLYKVTPRMVRVVTVPTKIKRNSRTGKMGVRGGGKKAYVYLKKGDTITLH